MTDHLSIRPRRLRQSAPMRALVRETTLRPSALVLPAFVREGIREPQPISSMPGVVQHTLDSLVDEGRRAIEAGIGGLMLFGVPTTKDATGSGAIDPDGILNVATARLRDEFGDDLLVMTDLCLDEFTDHGHCGVLDDRGRVDNDATLEVYSQMAVAQAEAGAHLVGPSGMMDGQVGVIRRALDRAGFTDVTILAYTAKYASAFYGPFREAVNSSLTGDRRTYQQDPANLREALRELELDVAEGADIVMVKPGMPYLDVLTRVAEASPVPVAAYQVSGEYAMIQAAAERGWIDRERAILESLTGFVRAGADVVLTYAAIEAARWITEPRQVAR
ncbi:porphobilinogen synthase [Propionibacteriaceae bacterium Y1923]|uniref:porphobilinogen synthase n=1 Tax=Aestuariimicrobium sp. Y1814 TaxID=3418742 RepID=UPI003C26A258